jgi:transaldolase/glucose-6-phosphate isomerase
MKENPLLRLQEYGQSIWQDYIRRQMITSGELKQLVEEDGLRGVTSNPKIFDKVIAGSHDYDEEIRALALEGKDIEAIYQALTVEDVQRAADVFRPLYDDSSGRHGFVSLEVNPHLAHDTEGTVEEARRLWAALDRPNVFIKVPATLEGLPAIQQLIAEGINVNVTLLFGLPRYRKVAESYIAGLEERARQGEGLERVASVASFFLSRIDVLVDPQLEEKMKESGPEGATAEKLHGQVAIASAGKAYQIYKEIFHGERFQTLADRGARTQRVLWASTSTKNPDYSDIKYVEALIGPETINTLPQETLNAYRDHGDPAPRLETNLDLAEAVLDGLGDLEIDIDQVTQQLEDEGVEKFNKPYDSLMETLEEKRQEALGERVDPQTLGLGDERSAVQQRLTKLEDERFCARLWRKDPALWKEDSKAQVTIVGALGWLHVAEKLESNIHELKDWARVTRAAGFRHVVHMGMGGSSLAPLAFQRTFPVGDRGIPLTVLDTTDPATIQDIEGRLALEKTLFIVASKSGTTAEPRAFGEYFYGKVQERKGARAGENFVAITDPGTPLAELAEERGFRRAFLNYKDIGGRYSALSYFGLVPAALMDMDVEELLVRALRMMHACSSCVPADQSPAVVLGSAIGELAARGRDKLTFLAPATVATLGMWLEQLLAESTGKEGTGILPVAGEPVGPPAVYGSDRLFVYFRVREEPDEELERSVLALQEAGRPVITIEMADRLDLGQELFRWEVATATAGRILGINPFNQPNVQESKDNTNRLLQAFQDQGRLPEQEPALQEGPLRLYARNGASTIKETVGRLLRGTDTGGYLALLAYFKEDEDTGRALQAMRRELRDRLRLATTLGYGPRYLHSTGQLHKGGPNTGLFFLLTADDPTDLDIPGKPYSFGTLKQAQAQGDLEALRKHGRQVVRIDLGEDVNDGLSRLRETLKSALEG